MRRLYKTVIGVVVAVIAGVTLLLVMADGFRTSMVHLGSWFVPEGDASGFHDVYTEKETVEAFRKTGKFPDGATLVKELRASNSGTYTTGPTEAYPTLTSE